MKGHRIIGYATTFAAALALVGPACAADATQDGAAGAASAQSSAAAGSGSETTKDLEKKLDQRDALIRDLLQRVERLERQAAARAAAGPQLSQAAPGTPLLPEKVLPLTEPRAAAPISPQPTILTGEQGQLAQNPPAAPSPAPAAEAAPGQPAAPQAAPGQFEVSEEAAQHALEIALVQTGALLLPPWALEFVPSLTYQYARTSITGQTLITTSGLLLGSDNVTRSNQLAASALFRAGLPWDSQVEVGIPYDYKRFSTATSVLGSGLGEQTTQANGFGDPTLTLTKQVLQEGEWRPSLFASATWESYFGQGEHGIPLGNGVLGTNFNFNEFRASMTAVKRQDPLVFTAGFTYQTALENGGITPGDQFTPALGMLFAVSPETSLQFSQQVTFAKPTSVGNRSIPGSEETSGILSLGVLSILARGLSVQFTAGVGETRDAPDLTLLLAFPIRLN
jgi:hypothetical protein